MMSMQRQKVGTRLILVEEAEPNVYCWSMLRKKIKTASTYTALVKGESIVTACKLVDGFHRGSLSLLLQ